MELGLHKYYGVVHKLVLMKDSSISTLPSLPSPTNESPYQVDIVMGVGDDTRENCKKEAQQREGQINESASLQGRDPNSVLGLSWVGPFQPLLYERTD